MNRSMLFVIVQFVLLAVFAASTILTAAVPESPVKLLGILAMVGGVAVFAAALYAFQKANATLPNIIPDPKAGSTLVRSGIYGIIRHPIYTGVLALTAGIALYHGNLIVIALWGVLVVFFWVKSSYEETQLRRQFPEYTAYRRQTGRFLPSL